MVGMGRTVTERRDGETWRVRGIGASPPRKTNVSAEPLF